MGGSFGRNVVTVGALTAVSRVLGFVRDMVMAWLLGAGLLADAFVVAYRLPNLLRRFMAEGAVSVAFVPVFSEVKEREGLESAYELARKVFTLMSAALGAVAVLGILASPLLVAVVAPGFVGREVFGVTVHLTRIMFPYILLIGVAALFMGVLNSVGHFAMPAAAPIVMNVFMIGVPVIMHVVFRIFDSPADALAWGVIAGGVAQIIIQIPALRARGIRVGIETGLMSPRVKKVVRLVGVASLGASIYQINVLVGTLLASMLPQGSVSYLYYANRILELPLGVFAFAVGNVLLPSMSSARARMEMERLSEIMGKGSLAVLLFTIPASVGAIVLAEPIFSVLFIRGRFTWADAQGCASALIMYGVSLWAVGYTRIQTQALYALQKARSAVTVSWVALVANVALCLALMPVLGHAGIALAGSLSVFLQLVLQRRVTRREGIRVPREYLLESLKMTLAALAMGALLVPFALLDMWKQGPSLVSASVLGGCVVAGSGVYFLLLKVLGVKSFETALQRIMHRGSW